MTRTTALDYWQLIQNMEGKKQKGLENLILQVKKQSIYTHGLQTKQFILRIEMKYGSLLDS